MPKSNHTILMQTVFSTLLTIPAFYSISAHAGSDMTCELSTALNTQEYDYCNNLPILTASNDNKINMSLLLSDMGLAKIDPPIPEQHTLWDAEYSFAPFDARDFAADNKIPNQRTKVLTGDGYYDERCTTIKSGHDQFIDQVQQHKNISNAEKQALIQARKALMDCEEKQALLSIDPAWGSVARQYASYLNASIAFYNTNFSTAAKIYTVLSTIDDAWLKETSQYMLIRTSLNAAYATGKDQYGDVNLDQIDKTLLNQFLQNINLYLKQYPEGMYAASSRGFLRRAYWLTGRQDLLVNELVWQINHPQSKLYNLEIHNLPAEIDRRIFDSQYFDPKNFKDPFFLTVYDLMAMRKPSDEKDQPISWTELNAQKAYFKDQAELFQYLQATHLLIVQNKPQEALKYLPESSSVAKNHLQLSQQFLRGQALEKINPVQAESYWTQRIKSTNSEQQRSLFATALSNHLAQKQNAAAFTGKNALIAQPILQKRFIVNRANETSLEHIINAPESTTEQKQAALYTLLFKALDMQNYQLFNQYYPKLPANAAQYKGYDSTDAFKNLPPFANFIWNGNSITPQLKCPPLPQLTQQLEKTPDQIMANICMGEYVRNSQYGLPISWNENTEKSTFSGKVFARGNIYKQAIKTQPTGDLHAYALYRAVMCYAPSGSNDCQDEEVPKSIRKQWFDQLKLKYPNSSWAKSLKYYW